MQIAASCIVQGEEKKQGKSRSSFEVNVMLIHLMFAQTLQDR